MDTEDQNAAFEAAKEIVLEAREKMAACMEEVLVVGMSLRYHRGKKREVAIGELLAIYSERNEVFVRKGRIMEVVPVIDIAEILDAPEPFDEDMFEEGEDDPETSHGWRGSDGELVKVSEFEEGMKNRDSMSDEELESFARKMSGYTGP